MTSASTWLWQVARKCAQRIAAVMALFLLLPTTLFTNQAPICAIDMGSNSFRRIVGLFSNDRYTQTIETVTLGVGDDLAAHGRISENKLVEIEKALSGFRASCDRAGASRVMAIGTAAFRDAPNADVVVNPFRHLM
jgi:exopolyphosphatase/pppGpp-phosphohydrolase